MINFLSSRSIYDQVPFKEEVLKYLKPEMKVAILGFSFFDSFNKEKYLSEYDYGMPYDLKMKEMFLNLGIKSYTWIHYHVDSKDDAIKKIKEADIIYFPGGAPDLMMIRIYEYGLEEVLKDQNKIYMGSSAGAMIQKDIFHISPDNEYHKFMIVEGLGLLSGFHFDVHYRRRNKQKSAIKKVHRNTKEDIYAIMDDGMMIIDNNKIKLVGNAFKLYDKKGVIKKWEIK